jgi:hypothetical protein
MRLWRRTPDPNPHQPWWVKYNPDIRESNPNFRPPKSRPGQDRLRDRLSELFACGAYKEFRQELGLPKEAIARFMAGENSALTPGQTQAVARYLDEFGRDMETNRLVRRRRS